MNDFSRKTYHALKPSRLKAYLFGTRAMEREWATRHCRESKGEGADWVRRYWDSRGHPHRALLAEALAKFPGLDSLLEIGSNCGVNLALFAGKFPHANFTGIDVNPMAVRMGNEWIQESRLGNVVLEEGSATNMSRFSPRSFDVVLTDAVLLYVGPDQIKAVIADIFRIARRAIILCEWQDFSNLDSSGKGLRSGELWRRDYRALLKAHFPEANISVAKIPEESWPETGWREWGAVIEAVL